LKHLSLDKATMKKVAEKKEVLGFLDALNDEEKIVEAYEGEHAINCPIYFLKGNHEDYSYLDSLASNKYVVAATASRPA